MALALTEEHLALADSVRGWAAHTAPPAAVRAGLEAEDRGAAHYRDTLRPGLAAQGLLGLHLPEALGGQGYGLPELAVATEELGRALFPGAFLPTALASAVLASAVTSSAEEAGSGVLESLIKGIAAGTLTAAVALAPGIRATGGPGDLVIDGSCGPVLGACFADLLILPAAAGGEESWVAVDAADLEITPLDSLDLTRPVARVSASGLRVPAGRVLSGLSPGLVRSLAATLFAAEACGIAGWAVDTAASYAKIRHQFGRPIGQFQAVKHRCSWMLTAAEQAAAAVWDAARSFEETGGPAPGDGVTGGRRPSGGSGPWGPGARPREGGVLPRVDTDPGRDFAAAVAAAVAVDAGVTCTGDCIQVLGGIGYTWEHDAHLYYRRALSLRALLGSSGSWAARVARLALDGATRPVRVELPAEAEAVRGEIAEELAVIAAAPAAERAKLLAAGGWVTPHMPRPWGRDASPLDQLVIAEEMRAAGLRPPGLGIGAWVVPALVQYGTAEQQQRFLPATLSGETVWCQLFSEPGAGSDLASLSTRAERDAAAKGDGEAGGGWRLTGQKVWTSLAAHASWAICVARTDPDAPKHEGISYFLVDMKDPGVTVRPLREMTGDSLFNEVFLDGVFVPDDRVVGRVNDGWRVARTTLANERVSLSQSWTFGCGAPELLEVVRGLADPDAAVLERAGRLLGEGHAIDLLGLRAALKRLSGTEPGATGSVRKLLGMRYAQRISEECWALTGADGAVAGTRWSRAVLFTRALTIGGGTTDVQLNIIGERILGLPRDPAPGQ
jgi:alkylation response protein AidB-like acyl-CoA dehydrogenase